MSSSSERVALFLLMAPWLYAMEPVRTAWIRGAGPSAIARIQPDVHSVEFTESEAIVRSAGISLAYLGPLQASPQPKEQIRQFLFRIPLKPEPETGRHAHVGSEFTGAFLNGVPIYNQFEAASYRGQNLWHYDPMARKNQTHSVSTDLIEGLIPDRGRHSPVIGFALDGYPVYGPWAFDGGELRRMRSSYRLRDMASRDRWPDGTRLAPGQYGPAVDASYPLGSFVEDYEYVAGSGDLDQYNGRFAKTPEHPHGTYAYYLSTDEQGRLAFPYLLAHEYFGKLQAPAGPATIRLRSRSHDTISAGQPVVLQLDVLDTLRRPIRYLEYVHERPVHLMVVSEDLAEFDHIHPEVNEQGAWLVSHTFAYGGRHRLYADFTPPGSNQRVEFFDVTVQGPQRPKAPLMGASLEGLRAGEDTELAFKLPSTAEPYLGSWAHIAIAGEGLTSFIHAHPIAEGASPIRESEAHTHTAEALGPPPASIRVVTSFPAAGLYKLWVQFQVAGRVETLPFVARVTASGSRGAGAQIPADAIQIRITPGGFEPARIEIPAGKRLTLAFLRSGAPNCGGKVVFPDLGLSREVPLGGAAVIELPAQKAGELRFACGMGMYRGSIVAVTSH